MRLLLLLATINVLKEPKRSECTLRDLDPAAVRNFRWVSSLTMSDNGWAEHRKVVEYRLDQSDAKLGDIAKDVRELTESSARLEERTKIQAGIVGAVTGFIAGLTGWLK